MAPAQFAALKADFMAALAGGSELFVQDLYGGSQPEHRVCVRVVTELAWHSLFIRTMLIRPEVEELRGFAPDYTVIDLPSFRADPERHGCRSERSEEHTSELQSLMRISYAVFCLKKKKQRDIKQAEEHTLTYNIQITQINT